jgi:hypothetical protein
LDWIWATGGTGFVCWVRVGKWWKKEVWPTCSRRLPSANRRFKFDERSQLLTRVHDEVLTVVAVRISNPDRSPVGINR